MPCSFLTRCSIRLAEPSDLERVLRYWRDNGSRYSPALPDALLVNFQTVTINNISLTAGNGRIVRVVFDTGAMNMNWFKFTAATSDCTVSWAMFSFGVKTSLMRPDDPRVTAASAAVVLHAGADVSAGSSHGDASDEAFPVSSAALESCSKFIWGNARVSPIAGGAPHGESSAAGVDGLAAPEGGRIGTAAAEADPVLLGTVRIHHPQARLGVILGHSGGCTIKQDFPAIRRDARPPVFIIVVIGQLADAGAIGLHHKDFMITTAIGIKHQLIGGQRGWSRWRAAMDAWARWAFAGAGC